MYTVFPHRRRFPSSSRAVPHTSRYNPLSNITSAEVWNFLRVQEVPVNELHAQGYVSIGCEPCTRPVLPNQLEREGRWWWEDAARELRV